MAKGDVRKTTARAKKAGASAALALPAGVTAATESFPIVGIGASAGGLEAFTKLLSHLPTDTGMAFVLLQHLDPKHASMSSEILSRATRIPVAEVTNGMRVKPNCIYVIPPNF